MVYDSIQNVYSEIEKYDRDAQMVLDNFFRENVAHKIDPDFMRRKLSYLEFKTPQRFRAALCRFTDIE